MSNIHKHFNKILQHAFSLYTDIPRNQLKCFLVSNSIFIITKDLVFIIDYQTNFQKNHQQKDSNLLLQKRAREKKMTVIRIFNSKYIPPKYICKKVYNGKKFKERGG